MAVIAPDLATRLRSRLRALLDEHDRTQTEFAKALDVSRQTASLILKSPRALQATMTLDRLALAAQFFDIPVTELLLAPGEAQRTLAEDELDVLELYRLLPTEQRGNWRAMMRYIFQPRREAASERAALFILRKNIQRQIAESQPKKLTR